VIEPSAKDEGKRIGRDGPHHGRDTAWSARPTSTRRWWFRRFLNDRMMAIRKRGKALGTNASP